MFYLFVVLHVAHSWIQVTKENKDPMAFKLHSGERSVILDLPGAIDAQLIPYQSDSYCQAMGRGVRTETQEFTVIKESEFADIDLESDTPFNFRQFVGMAHVKDGMIAITSDLVVYLLKFNYSAMAKGGEFASIIWRADFQPIVNQNSRAEIGQVVYCEKDNLILLLFESVAQIFDLRQMELNTSALEVFQVLQFQSREIRGLTKEIDGYVFSAVGTAGLDIYIVKNQTLSPILLGFGFGELNITKVMNLKDFAVIRYQSYYRLFLLDSNYGAFIVDMKTEGGLNFIFVTQLDDKPDGIAIDTLNGMNIFVGRKENGRKYIITEYFINGNEWWLVNQYTQKEKIFDVDATDEFAIIQGQNSHRVIFANNYPVMVTHQNQKLGINLAGLRDFQYFKQATPQGLKSNDFFFGVTATHAFLSKFTIDYPRVECYSGNKQNQVQEYGLVYNISQIRDGLVQKDIVIQYTMNITVQQIQTLLYQDSIFALKIIGAIIAVMLVIAMSIICYWWSQFRKEQTQLEQQVSQFKSKSVDNKLAISVIEEKK